MDPKQKKKIEKLEAELRKVCRAHYEACVGAHRRFIPKHPYNLVRVLPKDHITAGGIILPDTEQNKPVYEAIVIETWRPFYEEVPMHMRDSEGSITGDYTGKILRESPLKPGDRIAFQHWVGIPLYGYLDDKYYRLVPETDKQGENSKVLGTIDFYGDYQLAAQLREITAKFYSVTTSGMSQTRRI